MAATKVFKNRLLRRPKDRPSEPVVAEPTKAEIMEDIRIGLQQAAAGEGRPARDVFRELRQKTSDNAHSR